LEEIIYWESNAGQQFHQGMQRGGKYHPIIIPSKSAIDLIAQLLCFLSSLYELEPFDRLEQQQRL